MIILKNAKKPLNVKEYDCFMNSSKYYLAVTKLNALLAKFLSRCEKDRYCLNSFSNFQSDEKLKKHEKSVRNHNHVELGIPEKFKTFLNKKSV